MPWSLNNSVFKRKIQDENDSVLEQKFSSQTKKKQQQHVTAKTKRKHFPVDHRIRYSAFVVTLCFIVTFMTFIVILCIYNFTALKILFSSLTLHFFLLILSLH